MDVQLAFELAPVYRIPTTESTIRQEVLANGVKALSLEELLGVLIGEEPAHSLWESVSDYSQPLQALRKLVPEELESITGLGNYKAATLLVAIELGYRMFNPLPMLGKVIDDPATAAAYFAPHLMWEEVEKFAVLMLDVNLRAIKLEVISVGAQTATMADPRVIFRAALRAGATRLIVAHNHPSGHLDPSNEDNYLIAQLIEVGNSLGIPVVDSLILSLGRHLSMRDTTSLWAGAEI